MRIPRIYTPQALNENSVLTLEESASHHCLKVLRMNVGRELILFNGDNSYFHASIVGANKKSAEVRTREKISDNKESPLDTHLGIALSRGDRFDLVLQKATELGATQITPLFTERTEVKLQAERLEKKSASWEKLIISACEQCGRNRIPALHPPTNLSAFFESVSAEKKYVLHHRNTARLSPEEKPESLALLIGPEGGLSDQEIAQAKDAGFENLALGPRVLRTETAPLAALAIVQSLWGDM